MTMSELGDFIALHRELQGMSRYTLADKVKCAPLDIIKIENGGMLYTSIGLVMNILDVLGCTLEAKENG